MRAALSALLLIPALAWAEPTSVLIYDAIGRADSITIEGRVVEGEQRSAATPNDPWWKNLWRNARKMFVSEREHAAVALVLHGETLNARADEEGYFRIDHLPKPAIPAGWHVVTVAGAGSTGRGKALIVAPTQTHGLISDVDDTVLVSEVTDKSRLLKNTFLKNPEQRDAFPGTADFYAALAAKGGDAPNGRALLSRLGAPNRPMHLLMDRAYEGNETRQLALDLGFIPVVPPLSTRVEPWEYDREMYKRRNEVERLFRRLKGYRRIFSRFEKLDVMFIGFISFALIADGLRMC